MLLEKATFSIGASLIHGFVVALLGVSYSLLSYFLKKTVIQVVFNEFVDIHPVRTAAAHMGLRMLTSVAVFVELVIICGTKCFAKLADSVSSVVVHAHQEGGS